MTEEAANQAVESQQPLTYQHTAAVAAAVQLPNKCVTCLPSLHSREQAVLQSTELSQHFSRSYRTQYVRPSVTLCIVALMVAVGGRKLYRRVPRTALPSLHQTLLL